MKYLSSTPFSSKAATQAYRDGYDRMFSRSACSNAGRYGARREPRCLGGQGCAACWKKWNERKGHTK